MPNRIEDGDAAYLLVRVGWIDVERGTAQVNIPVMGKLSNEWQGWWKQVVSLQLLHRAPEPRDLLLPK